MQTNWRRGSSRILAPAALVLGICGGAQTAKAGAFLWISAPAWTYSAAAAASPAGSAYFWALSVGAGTWSWAGAFSNDGVGDAAYAFAEAATGLGGLGAVNVAGFADPFADVGLGISIDPSNPGGFPTSDPNTDPFSAGAYTVSGTGITFNNESSSELNGVDEIEAFEYTGGTDMTSLENELGVSAESGISSTGDVTDFGSLTSLLGLVPLDSPDMDPSSNLAGLTFTENDSNVITADVIVVAEGDAVSTPEPATAGLLVASVLGLLAFRRRRTA